MSLYGVKLSIVIPCYNEQEAIPVFVKRIREIMENMKDMEYECIFVDDGSSDGTLSSLQQFAKADKRIRYVSLSRNFGKEAAMLAGLESASGAYTAIMDVDLQDPPELLPEMYRIITEEGFDCVATRRVTRNGEPAARSLFAKTFYRIMNKISHVEIVDGARDYRLMTRQVVNAILSLKEYNRFSKGIFGWVGFKTKWIEYENMPRVAGTTKWSFWKLFLYAIDGIIGFSTAPLAFSSVSGLLLCCMSFIGAIFIFIRRLLFGDPVAGWASITCIFLFANGIQLFCVGVLSQYVAKSYLELKQRPVYIVKETSDQYEINADGRERN